MADGLSSTAANALLTSLSGSYTWLQLHTAAPGSAGTTSVATNNTRKQITWTTPSSGAMTSSADLVWTSVAGSETYSHYSVWSASTAGTFGFSGAITANAVTTGDTFTVATGDVDHSFPIAS